MSKDESWSTRRWRWWNRMHARAATFARPATAFVSTPEPRTIGTFARGRQITGGNFLFAGFLVQAPATEIWDLPMPDAGFEGELHGFDWLDDLAAVGDIHANKRAQRWTHQWVQRFGKGKGPGWTPDLTGRRLIRWINHAILLLNGQDKDTSEAYFRSLASQTIFLSRRWQSTAPGLPRFEALTGLVYAGVALTGMDKHVDHAARAIGRECDGEFTKDGALITRNPEELLDIFTLLSWAATALQDAGRTPHDSHLAAIKNAAPILRALRHADGGLGRFHGGGRGMEGRLDQALATAGVRGAPMKDRAMGYARIAHGRTSVIIDAEAPPSGPASYNAHASTLAFELTSGRRPLIVNCGSGATFGRNWRRAGRATPSHSTLGIEGYSSSRLGEASPNNMEFLTDVPTDVRYERAEVEGGTRVVVGHNGYQTSHGLTHARTLHLDFAGRGLRGEDVLMAMSAVDKKHIDAVFSQKQQSGIEFAIRFHLHPQVDATLDMGGKAVSMALKSGEMWVFRADGPVEMVLESSVYLETARLSPRATKQIVLTGVAMEYSTRISWSLAKTQDTPNAIRDYHTDEIEVPEEVE